MEDEKEFQNVGKYKLLSGHHQGEVGLYPRLGLKFAMVQICTDRPFRSMINRLIANCCFTRGPNYQRHPAAKMSTIVERHCLSSILNLYSLCYLMFRLCRRNVTLCRLFMIIYLCQQIIVYLVYFMILCVLVDVLRHFLLFHHVSSCFMTFHHCTF